MNSNPGRKKAKTLPLKKSLAFSCHPRYLKPVRTLIARMWRMTSLPAQKGRLVILAVDEALNSIIQHARGMRHPGEIEIKLELNKICFKATIKDHTNGLDFNCLNEQQKKTTLEQERMYQLEVFLIATIMDEVTYSYKKGFENELELVYFI